MALFIILVGLIYYLKKWWFQGDAYVVSWPAYKNLELTLLGLSAYRVAIFGLTGCCISWCPPSLFIHKNISFSEMECLWWWYVRCFLFLFQTVFKTLTFLFNVKQMKIVDATIITDVRSHFSNFSCMFLSPNIFFLIWILNVLIYQIWENSKNKLKKYSVTKSCSDLLLFE